MNNALVPPDGQSTPDAAKLEGILSTDAESIRAAADDFGHIMKLSPRAVVKPRSEEDVINAVRYARGRGLKIAQRGGGHSTNGQTQVQDGIVLDMAEINAVHAVEKDRLTIGGGARWAAVVDAALAQGSIPPVLTDYFELTVGGTLSIAGMGRTTHRYGFQVDNVLSLEVVTGDGERRECSPDHDKELFGAILAGGGQSGVILRATLRLVPAPKTVRAARFIYGDLGVFIDAMIKLASDGRVESVCGTVARGPEGGWLYVLDLASYGDAAPAMTEADMQALLPGTPALVQNDVVGFADHIRGPSAMLGQLRASDEWKKPHPWVDLIIPSSAGKAYVADILAEMPGADVDSGFIVVAPIRTDRVKAPLLRVPSEQVSFVIDVERFAKNDASVVEELLKANRALYERSLRAGGTAILSGSIPMGAGELERHFGAAWADLQAVRRRVDPDGVFVRGSASA